MATKIMVALGLMIMLLASSVQAEPPPSADRRISCGGSIYYGMVSQLLADCDTAMAQFHKVPPNVQARNFWLSFSKLQEVFSLFRAAARDFPSVRRGLNKNARVRIGPRLAKHEVELQYLSGSTRESLGQSVAFFKERYDEFIRSQEIPE